MTQRIAYKHSFYMYLYKRTLFKKYITATRDSLKDKDSGGLFFQECSLEARHNQLQQWKEQFRTPRTTVVPSGGNLYTTLASCMVCYLIFISRFHFFLVFGCLLVSPGFVKNFFFFSNLKWRARVFGIFSASKLRVF